MGGSTSSLAACMCGRTSINVNGKRYFHQEKLGEGGFSYVDLVEDGKFGKFFALKRIICHDNKAEKDGIKEAEYCGMFQHPNIIPLIDHCVKRKSTLSEVWLIFPFYKRGTLFDEYQRLQNSGEKMSNNRVLSIFQGICSALQAFHHHKPHALAHRDIKPANVLLTDDDVPVVMDLGSMAPAQVRISSHKEAQTLQDLASERCTMPYRAPELFQVPVDATVDEKVDIWSLGCVLFSLMYLEGPFDQVWMRKDSVALAVQNNKLPFPSDDPYPVELRHLVSELLTIDVRCRPDIDTVMSTVEHLQSFI